MGYVLQAVIAGYELLRAGSRDVPGVGVAPLRQGLSLMPMTDEVFDTVTDGSAAGSLGFRRLPGVFEKLLARWSAAGPVAHVEAEYSGGVGEQHAAVRARGVVVVGPLHVQEGQAFGSAGGPVSQALRRLGVAADAATDGFATAGLDRHRSSEAGIS